MAFVSLPENCLEAYSTEFGDAFPDSKSLSGTLNPAHDTYEGQVDQPISMKDISFGSRTRSLLASHKSLVSG